ncbi:uncharacterized protein LOC105216534 [Zeugodacus cucurbitae]|uniref:uncharacterized protein LOC105216534 n=1 Tax=Zeugodacus cucurbitae TaxID=28588 RepID=UPI0023D8E78E|nr:uncharacterized protein LOC105216534 [Zeugodacus cucurbitae]
MRYSHWSSKFNCENKHLHEFSQLSKVESKPFKFETHLTVRSEKTYDKTDLPIEFKVSPESLVHLAAKVVDRLPLPDVYRWTNDDVCNWLKRFGYPQYEYTFRANLITGRKLLLIDAKALCAMNIKNFNHIKRLTNGIRELFYFEMTTFMRSISLAPHHHYEIYKLFRTNSGYKHLKCSDLLFQLKLLREKSKYPCHWDILEHWLSREASDKELFGANP